MPFGKKITGLVAQAIAIAYIFFVMAFIIGEATPDIIKGEMSVSFFLILFFCGMLGFVLAYRYRRTGAWLQIFSSVGTLLYFTVISNTRDIVFAAIIALPFLISGTTRLLMPGKIQYGGN